MREVYTSDHSAVEMARDFEKIAIGHNTPLKENVIHVPNTLGEGYYQRMILDNQFEISREKIKFHKDIQMMARTRGEDVIAFYFSLDKNMDWVEEISKTSWEINENQGVMANISNADETCTFKENKVYNGIKILMDRKRIERHLCFDICSLLKKSNGLSYGNYISMMDSTKRIIHEIEYHPFNHRLKYMFLEAKAIELITHVFNQMLEIPASRKKCVLSRMDLNTINHIREYIDLNFEKHLTIKGVSKIGNINEQKLKQGFKMVYGRTVHSYIVDQRLKKAVELLENGFLINEVSYMVGYKDASSFSRAFKKQYKFSPVEVKNKLFQ